MKSETLTQCPYCGVGCGLVAHTENGRLTKVSGDARHPVNYGATCRKPLGLPDAVHAPDRALTPLWRTSADARFDAVSWRTAIGRLARRLTAMIETHGPDSVAFYISGQLATEDYYVVSKLVKGFLGTNNVDSNSRLCMSSAVAGYVGALGSDGPPAAYADIAKTDCMLLVGSNTAACHPIVWTKIKARQADGAKVIVVDPRLTPTAVAADIHLALRPGTDLPLLASMLGILADENLIDHRFVDRHTEGFADALSTAREWPPSRAAEVCNIPESDIVVAARAFGAASRAMALWSMGVNQSTVGTLKNRALINLCLATGNIGRPGSGPLSLTGQPNAMGGRESGGLSTLLPGYRSVTDPEHRAEMRRLWKIPSDAPGISPLPGLPTTEFVEALEAGTLKAVWVVATNPVVSQPDAQRFTAALRRADLIVCQDAYHPTETSSLAHVVLPAAGWPEKDGTMTNSERRVGLLRKAIDPPGDALPDWEIFARLGRALGHTEEFSWRRAADVYAEFARLTDGRICDVSGLTHDRLAREGPLQWPVPSRSLEGSQHGGTERLYVSRRFPTPTGRARFEPTPHSEPADTPNPKFPIVLNTGRLANQWHTMTRTSKSPDLNGAEPEPFIEVHAEDALAAGIRDGERIRVRSRRGHAVLRARVSENVTRGTAFAPFHWGALHLQAGHGALNAVVARAIDPTSKQAELKASAIRLEPFRAHTPGAHRERQPATSAQKRLLVIGTGMSAISTVEALLAHDEDGWDITMVGREPDLPYNRVMLSQYLAGTISEHDLQLHHPGWFTQRNITLRAPAEVRTLDLKARAAELTDGDRLAYDKLVLATGSQPFLPPVAGLHREGAFAFRTLEDTRAILAATSSGARAVVIGGGLLGLEAARGLRGRGMKVMIVHLADRLMEQQLDPLGAQQLERAIRELGIGIRLGARAEAITGNGSVEGVTLTGGEHLDADIVLLAAGVRPDVSLARNAGLEVDRAIIVDDELRTSEPGVYAAGECVQHRDTVYGLWAPLLQQAKAAGASLAGAPTAFRGNTPATTLKAAGIDLFCGGRTTAHESDEEILAFDSRHGRYRRLVINDGKLIGAILLGDIHDARALRELLANNAQIPEALLNATPGDSARAATLSEDPATTVCSCMAISQADIIATIRALNLTTVEQIAKHTRASTGCGGCRGDVAAVLAAHRATLKEPTV